MEPFATLAELVDGLEWELDEGETRLAVQTLEEASDLVRAYGRNWTPENVPGFVKRLTLKITARFLRNPDAYVTSRAGDETVSFQEVGAQHVGVYLTREEQKLVKKFTGTPGIVSVPIVAHRSVGPSLDHLVSVGDGKPFPFGPVSPSHEPGTTRTTDEIPTRPL